MISLVVIAALEIPLLITLAMPHTTRGVSSAVTAANIRLLDAATVFTLVVLFGAVHIHRKLETLRPHLWRRLRKRCGCPLPEGDVSTSRFAWAIKELSWLLERHASGSGDYRYRSEDVVAVLEDFIGVPIRMPPTVDARKEAERFSELCREIVAAGRVLGQEGVLVCVLRLCVEVKWNGA